ncbi:hypothetical protein FOB72_13645 [Cupriavidus pauculus]|uniref:RelA/SpoT domain-containing protein n=1 Tax=Cupriavidus pauculus TaxID=82633 RepID=A0A5P2H5K1_9BURK|nr:RelA/SpoT domain-containing protein [Cupriavidus pauculus]QET02988.1 hypothetical protein FOB72_13645 [Cupriavidus pauculus]
MSNPSTSGDIIAQFIGRYRREFDFFEQAGRIVAQQLEAQLESSGIRAMVTSRAKNPKRLEAKVRQRGVDKKYAAVEDIFADIVDLAGVRVALYFPAERSEVDKIIREKFFLNEEPKEFKGTSGPASYRKRFTGYWATHYRLQIQESTLADANKRFSEARVEVQVASVLMHAWSEVEHDLVYKPLQGELSEDELAILDELNGMVLTGEIALERLQRAAEVRLSKQGANFENHYDLASYLVKYVRAKDEDPSTEPVVGDVQLLFRLLKILNISNPDDLAPYLENLSPGSESRPVSEQIADRIVAADPERYNAYALARKQETTQEAAPRIYGHTSTSVPAHEGVIHPDNGRSDNGEIGFFLAQWITLERFLREMAEMRGMRKNKILFVTNRKLVEALQVFTAEQLSAIEFMRRVRNNLVHGIEMPDVKFVQLMGEELSSMLSQLRSDSRDDVRAAAERAMAKKEKSA